MYDTRGSINFDSFFTVSQEEIEACRAAHRDMLEALKARKDALEDALKKRTEQLKALCLKEAVSLCVFKDEIVHCNDKTPRI